jgi:hypothetical protein
VATTLRPAKSTPGRADRARPRYFRCQIDVVALCLERVRVLEAQSFKTPAKGISLALGYYVKDLPTHRRAYYSSEAPEHKRFLEILFSLLHDLPVGEPHSCVS